MSFFKKQSIIIKKNLKEKGLDIPLGSIHEILAKSYGFKNKHIALGKADKFEEVERVFNQENKDQFQDFINSIENPEEGRYKVLSENYEGMQNCYLVKSALEAAREIVESKGKTYMVTIWDNKRDKEITEGELIFYINLLKNKKDFDKVMEKIKNKRVEIEALKREAENLINGVKKTSILEENKIEKNSLAYQDFCNCLEALKDSPKILKILFKDLEDPQRPRPIETINLQRYSGGEAAKIKIAYDIWNGTGKAGLADLAKIDMKDKKTFMNYVVGSKGKE